MMYQKGKVYSLQELVEKFLIFAQFSNDSTQAWELVDDRADSFYGATLRVPINKYESYVDEIYYIVGDSFLTCGSGSCYIDDLKSKYPEDTFIEDYSKSGLDSILDYLNSIRRRNPGRVIFNGFETDISNGMKAIDVVRTCKDIVSKCDSLGLKASIFITPKRSTYSDPSIEEQYNILLRSSYISNKPCMVCLGDSITDFWRTETDSWSWTEYCQDDLPECTVVNKGVGGNQIHHMLERFNTDIIEQIPDFCFMLAGGNDMWDCDDEHFEYVKNGYTQMVSDCLSNGITPIIGLYMPTLEQVTDFVTAYPSLTDKTPSYIHNCFIELNQFCRNLANSLGLFVVDNIYNCLKDSNGRIIHAYVNSLDSIHLSKTGAERVGRYIADSLKSIFQNYSIINYNKDVINFYRLFADSLGVEELSESNLLSFLSSDGMHYNRVAFDIVDEYIASNEKLLHVAKPYFYVSLQHTTVTSSTYADWLRTGHRVEPYTAKFHVNEYSDWHTDIYYQSEKYNHSVQLPDTIRHVFGKYGGNERENAFKNTGEFVAVGVHRLFDKDLWMCEQGGITCEKEAREQINDINLLKYRSSTTPRMSGGETRESVLESLPVFPGTGCPWFTVSDANKSDFGVSEYGIEYWFTKNDYDATITIRFSNGTDNDVYQSMSLGMMDVIGYESYMYPLYVAGGNQALSQDVYTYTPIRGRYPTCIVGNIYDLDIQNICLSNSNLLYPTKFNGANMSNFRVMSPDGTWKDIYAYTQSAEAVSEFVCTGRASRWAYILNKPEPIMDTIEHSAYPLYYDTSNKIDTYTINKKYNQYNSSSMLEKIMVTFTNEKPHNNRGIQGAIPNAYSGWYRYLPSGEVELDGKKYLSVPNGWDNRLWKYPTFFGRYSDGAYYENDRVREYYDGLYNRLSNGMMLFKLLIPLEEGA